MSTARTPAFLLLPFLGLLGASLCMLWLIAHLLLRTPAAWMAVPCALAVALTLRLSGWRGLSASVLGSLLLAMVIAAAHYLMAVILIARISGRGFKDLLWSLDQNFVRDLILARFGPLEAIGIAAGLGLIWLLLRPPPGRA